MIDIAKARALIAAVTPEKTYHARVAFTGWSEALDALEEEQDSKKRGWALAMEHADTVNALKAEVARKEETRLVQVKVIGDLVDDCAKAEAENARLRKALRAAIPYVSATSINAEMWAALAAPQTGGAE